MVIVVLVPRWNVFFFFLIVMCKNRFSKLLTFKKSEKVEGDNSAATITDA